MKISRTIILIISQILLFCIIHDGIHWLYKQSFVVLSDISWGITITVAFWLFALISVVVSILTEFVFKSRQLMILLIGFLIFGAFVIQYIALRPYRTSLLLVSAFVALTVPSLILRKRD